MKEVSVLVVVFPPVLKERVVVHQEVAGEMGDEKAAEAESRNAHQNFLADRRYDKPDDPIPGRRPFPLAQDTLLWNSSLTELETARK